MVKIVLVGAGDRGNAYALYSLDHPDEVQIAGIVDPDAVRTNIIKERYSVPSENCFSSVEEFLERDKFADAVINGTMDELHVETSIPILRKGYDMLLEKPFAINEEEMEELIKVVKETGRKVYICHVLRYTKFYSMIKNHILNGDIGDVISVQLDEHVSYHHTVASYVRGKWRSISPMLLAKSSHDLDLMVWLLSAAEPVAVSSFGGDFQFLPEHKPEGAGSRCMVDCPYNDECVFSAESNYITQTRWQSYVWKPLEDRGEITKEMVAESLKTDNPFGKCVWDFDRKGNVDHQSVCVNFSNGATGVFNMVGGCASPERNIHVIGTRGEIKGCFEDQKYSLKVIAPKEELGFIETIHSTDVTGDMHGEHGSHGGGDMGLMADFISVLNGGPTSVSCTEIMDSLKSHVIAFKSEESRKTGQTIKLEFDKN